VGAVAAVLEAMDARRGFFDGVERLAARMKTETPRQMEVMAR
jgi:hypothetical protein